MVRSKSWYVLASAGKVGFMPDRAHAAGHERTFDLKTFCAP